MKRYTIERSKWRCGSLESDNHIRHGEGYTNLLNEQGFMCCLGQICEAEGVPRQKLMNVGYPTNSALREYNLDFLRKWHKGMDDGCITYLAQEAMSINDSSEFTRAQKEEKLIAHFKSEGYELEFVGKYTDEE